jgi:phosphoribosylamine--glycine ligase
MSQHETNVMILGSGGREHALAWKLRQSKFVGDIFVAPGNGGTEDIASSLDVDPSNKREVLEATKDCNAGLVVIGPEKPLVAGVGDFLRENNVLTYGPGSAGALLEGSKGEAVLFMKANDIPHPESVVFHDYVNAKKYLDLYFSGKAKKGVVIKADGPCDGKGVVVCDSAEQAQDAIEQMMVREEFGLAGQSVVIQKKLEGFEVSVMAIVSGDDYILLPTSEDHKQSHDNDQGKNTGGMGVAAPHPLVDDALLKVIEERIIRPTIAGLRKRKVDFRGTLYPGIMVTTDGPQVLEYNTRFGDPETEAIAPLLSGDLFTLLKQAAEGRPLHHLKYPIKKSSSIAVTLASKGYPGGPLEEREINISENVADPNVIVFHAGTARDEQRRLKTSGGRVLMVVGEGKTLSVARDTVYQFIESGNVYFDGMHYRRDIGARVRNK